jgi:glycosyltransferase involved in cell wall biosynthesis
VDANEAAIRCKLLGQDVRLASCAQGNLPPMLADLRCYRDWLDRVVCPGKLTQRFLVDWAGFDARRVRNIPNGADVPTVAGRVAREGPIRLGFVGRLTPGDKRAMDLVPLCAALESEHVDFTLDIAGDGPCRAELEAALGSTPRVRFLGPVPHERLYRDVYPRLDALVLTSASEAFGIVLVEAMMHGVVPVTSRYHGFHSEGLVIDGSNGLSFPVGDMVVAAACLRRLADDGALLARMSVESQARSAAYSWQRCLEGWRDEFTQLASEAPLLSSGIPAAAVSDRPGRLESLGLPPGLVDSVRRLRRAVLGPAVQAGGEEWPLFHRGHSPELLAQIGRALEALDRPASIDWSASAV